VIDSAPAEVACGKNAFAERPNRFEESGEVEAVGAALPPGSSPEDFVAKF
jgi:hypothetical protein